jgi:hypothetical protein
MLSRVRLLPLAVIAMVMLGVATAPVASAAMVLPEFKDAENSTSSMGQGTMTVEGGAAIKCEKAEGRQNFKTGSKDLGTYTITWHGCTQGGESCEGLGGTAAAVEMTGEWHLVLEEKSGTHLWLILFLLPPTDPHVECPKSAVKLFLLLGVLLGLIEPGAGSSAKEFKVIIEAPSGMQREKTFENNEGKALETQVLLVSQEGGKEKKVGAEAREVTLKFPATNEIKN